jgi:hypothetical protein
MATLAGFFGLLAGVLLLVAPGRMHAIARRRPAAPPISDLKILASRSIRESGSHRGQWMGLSFGSDSALQRYVCP